MVNMEASVKAAANMRAERLEQGCFDCMISAMKNDKSS
jgi:hypothetical protein